MTRRTPARPVDGHSASGDTRAVKLPKSMSRLALEVDGWLELGCPEYALTRMRPLLDTPGARPVGLMLRVRALIELSRFAEALRGLDELRTFEHDAEWLDVQEAWCQKRLGDLRAAADCMERLVRRQPRSAIGHYNLGCYLALLGERERAIEQVTIACGLDESFRSHARSEHDLDTLRDDPRFVRLMPPDELA